MQTPIPPVVVRRTWNLQIVVTIAQVGDDFAENASVNYVYSLYIVCVRKNGRVFVIWRGCDLWAFKNSSGNDGNCYILPFCCLVIVCDSEVASSEL